MRILTLFAAALLLPSVLHAAEPRWVLGAPLVNADATLDGKPVKLVDPAIVRDPASGLWHVFASASGGTVWFSMKDFTARPAVREVTRLPVDRCFVPQVFYHRAQQRWHMIGMVPDTTGRFPKMAPCLCTSTNLSDPQSWSKPEILDVPPPQDAAKPVKLWIDFWVICDDAKAHLFATSADGRLWRSETTINKYPHGWSAPFLALEGPFIYASHTYRQAGQGPARYLTTITARGTDPATPQQPRQYQQSYTAEHLEGPWHPAEATPAQPYAGSANIRLTDPRWTCDISHGEPLRLGNDERMLLDLQPPGFIFHGSYRSSPDPKEKPAPCVGLLVPEKK